MYIFMFSCKLLKVHKIPFRMSGHFFQLYGCILIMHRLIVYMISKRKTVAIKLCAVTIPVARPTS